MTIEATGTAGGTPAGPIDVSAWIGGYPYRELPHPDPEVLVRVLAREGFGGAWVGHLPGAFHRDPAPSNRQLYTAVAPHRALLHPTPIVRPDWPHWERTLQEAVDQGAPAVRIYPGLWGLGPRHPALTALAEACARAGVVLHVTLRFEDLRQRHPIDGGSDVLAATIRGLVRQDGAAPRPVVLVAGAGREVIEEIHWGLTPEEQGRAFYDFHWVWGPPEDHFAHLVRTLGPERLALSSWWPLRLTQQSRALIDLLPAAASAAASADETATEMADVMSPAFAAFADGRRMEARAAAVAHGIT